MANYFDFPITNDAEMREMKEKYLNNFDKEMLDFGTGESHDKILSGATNGKFIEQKDDFLDPRPGHAGEKIEPDRAIITNDGCNNYKMVGMTFTDKKGEFCCSYFGDFDTIVASNKEDIQQQRNRPNVARVNDLKMGR